MVLVYSQGVQLSPKSIPEHSVTPKEPQPPRTTTPLSVSVDLPVLDVSHQWNRTVCVLLCLLLSLSIVFSGSLHVVMNVRASPLFLVEGHSRVEGHV